VRQPGDSTDVDIIGCKTDVKLTSFGDNQWSKLTAFGHFQWWPKD